MTLQNQKINLKFLALKKRQRSQKKQIQNLLIQAMRLQSKSLKVNRKLKKNQMK